MTIGGPLVSVPGSLLWSLTNTAARLVLARGGRKLSVPVISVGNIVAGGVGKTEVAAAIARRLTEEGKRVVVASRGYASQWEKSGAIAQDFTTASSLRFPDEALVILSKAPGAAVAVGADRVGVLSRHWEELNPDVVVLDDGFQHFKLARNLDILVHDFSVPWPLLRDLPSAFRRVDLRVSFSELPPYWARQAGQYPWVRANYILKGAAGANGESEPLPKRALVFCGLGNPGRFRKALAQAGVEIAGFRAFGDHARYSDVEARRLVSWQATNQGLPLLTTLKDYVKLRPLLESQGAIGGFEPRWVKIELNFTENADLFWRTVTAAARPALERGRAF